MRAIRWGALGLLPWLVAQFIAFGIGGAGHGWIAPFYFSIPLFFLYPLVFIRAFSNTGKREIDAAILVIAAVLDTLLLRNALYSESEYVIRMWGDAGGVVALWLALWVGWQILTVLSLARKRHPQGVPSSQGTATDDDPA
ncbi:MAG TPA: hypothetical protein VFW19_02680 [Allosphingosinicella sp.]|nr:hypothetical protein [Allosphingosinicella sp.]